MKRFVVLCLLALSQLTFAGSIDRSTPEQQKLSEELSKKVDGFVAEAFKNIQDWQDQVATRKGKDELVGLFESTIDGLEKSGFRRLPHYRVYIGNQNWHDEETSFDTPKYFSLKEIFEAYPLAAYEQNLLDRNLKGREGKFVVITRLHKDIDAGGDFYFTGEVRLTIRYWRYYQNNEEILSLTPALVETSFRRDTTLEGNGSSAGGPR